jgi:hypothetical protein
MIIDAASAVVTAVVGAGGLVVFCGRTKDDELTESVLDHAAQAARGSAAVELLIPQIEYERCSLSELSKLKQRLAPTGTLRLVSSRGRLSPTGHVPWPKDHVGVREALTALRRVAVRLSDARVAVGGKVSATNDSVSGILQECELTLSAGAPLVVLGGFGGTAGRLASVVYSHGRPPSASSGDGTTGWDATVVPIRLGQLAIARAGASLWDVEIRKCLARGRDPRSVADAAVRAIALSPRTWRQEAPLGRQRR